MINCKNKIKTECKKYINQCIWCEGKTRKYCRRSISKKTKKKKQIFNSCKQISKTRCKKHEGEMDKMCKLSKKNRCIYNKHMKIISWNVNGIRSKSMNIIKDKQFNEDSHLGKLLKEHDPDILCLGETKCQCKHVDDLKKILPFEYQTWSCSTEKLGYSGVAIFSKHPYKELGRIPGLENNTQGRSIFVEFPTFYLVNVYVPNSGTNEDYRKNEWDSKVFEFLKEYKKKKKPIIYGGDLNVVNEVDDIYNPEIIKKARSPGVKEFERANFKQLLALGYIDTMRSKHKNDKLWTWWDTRTRARAKDRGWRLDYFLTSKKSIVKEADILKDVYGSDHCPISLTIKS